MPYRAVLRLTQYTQTVGYIEQFLAQVRELGVSGSTRITYMLTEDTQEPVLVVELPEKAATAFETSVKPKPPTKAQQAVTDQLAARKQAVKAKQPVPGHVDPVAKNGKVIVRRKRKSA